MEDEYLDEDALLEIVQNGNTVFSKKLKHSIRIRTSTHETGSLFKWIKT